MATSSTMARMPDETDAKPAPGISFRKIGMQFPDGTEALRDVSFDVSKGEFVSVVGPSGCGKSTLLRIASGLAPESSGEVLVNRDNIGYVFQDATLLEWRTALKNVTLLGELHGYSKAKQEALAREAIELVGLKGFENHYPKALSGGMKMRVSLARALTMKPEIFLFDEPFGAVDEITREHLNDETQRLFQKERFAGLFITHSISEAVYMSTKIYVMSSRPGRIIAEFDVPFPYPRTQEIRYSPDFGVLCAQVSEKLRSA
ncbi:MAG: ABC transporter ATP-binding protein [Castellaniella sp.]|uniref:ABC transporter ATP-binding protein n=1 Tax=Castellaniella hirudinis TaxID=1144617 RepID=A0ABV8RVY0_9BURK